MDSIYSKQFNQGYQIRNSSYRSPYEKYQFPQIGSSFNGMSNQGYHLPQIRGLSCRSPYQAQEFSQIPGYQLPRIGSYNGMANFDYQQPLSAQKIKQLKQQFFDMPDIYWKVEKPNRTLKLSGSTRYVTKNHLYGHGYDRFVYWPDYKVAGKISDIVNAFRNAGIQQVEVGNLFGMSNGQLGCRPRSDIISEQLVAECSFDPTDQRHQELFDFLLQSTRDKIKQQYRKSVMTNELLDKFADVNSQQSMDGWSSLPRM